MRTCSLLPRFLGILVLAGRYHFSTPADAKMLRQQLRPRAAVLFAESEMKDGQLAESKPVTGRYEPLKSSVLRVLSYSKAFHWSRPFDRHARRSSIGSGFIVALEPEPIITTNAHVIQNANKIMVQLPDFGRHRFRAYVSTICNDADVALLRFASPSNVLKLLEEGGVSLQALPLSSATPALGQDVVAAGFPLGQTSLKLSMGVVSGVEHVSFHYKNLAIQSTAIISSGNSGSPLLDKDTLKVVGINYAKNPNEAQINYVIPVWRLKQVLRKAPQKSKKNIVTLQQEEENGVKAGLTYARPDPYRIRLVPLGIRTEPGLPAFFQNAPGCPRRGVLIASVEPLSVFRHADPPVRSGDFLLSMNGANLDYYGMGRRAEYVDDFVNYADLMYMVPDLEDSVKFEACDGSTGEVRTHTMSLAWRDEYHRGVHWVYEPDFEDGGTDWEVFGDLLFMDLTENMVNKMNGEYHSWALVRFLNPQDIGTPRLAVSLRRTGTDAQDALGLGSGQLHVVESVNGHQVNSLEELRAHFLPDPLKEVYAGGSKESPPTNGRGKLKDLADALEGGKKTPASAGFAAADSSTRNSSERHSNVPSATSFLLSRPALHARAVSQNKANKDDVVWTLRTQVGAEYSAFFRSTLESQVLQAQRDPSLAYLLTPGCKSSARSLGILSKDKAGLLAHSSTASTSVESSEMESESILPDSENEDDESLEAEPLLFFGRSQDAVFVDLGSSEAHQAGNAASFEQPFAL